MCFEHTVPHHGCNITTDWTQCSHIVNEFTTY